MNKAFNFLLIFSFLVTLSACNDEGGGVIITQDPPPAGDIGTPGPFGGPLDNDEGIPDPSAYNPDYNSITLQALIDAADAGATIELDRDASLTSSIEIHKPVIITSAASLGRRAKISIVNSASLFEVQSDDFELHNLELELVSTSSLVNSVVINGVSSYNNFTMDKTIVKLRGSSSAQIKINNGTIIHNTILGLSSYRKSDTSVMELTGSGFSVLANVIVDVDNHYQNGLLLSTVSNATVQDNVIRAFAEPSFGAISGENMTNVIIRNNILHDANTDKSNTVLGSGDVGSIGLSFRTSDTVTDQGSINLYASQMYRYDDSEENFSFNVSFTAGVLVADFDKDDLFNFPPTEDFTPLCSASDPSVITINSGNNTHPNWQSYQGPSSGQTFWYAGAIQPACI